MIKDLLREFFIVLIRAGSIGCVLCFSVSVLKLRLLKGLPVSLLAAFSEMSDNLWFFAFGFFVSLLILTVVEQDTFCSND